MRYRMCRKTLCESGEKLQNSSYEIFMSVTIQQRIKALEITPPTFNSDFTAPILDFQIGLSQGERKECADLVVVARCQSILRFVLHKQSAWVR